MFPTGFILIMFRKRQIYCCLGMLSIVGRLDVVKADALGWWLSERQLPSGGNQNF